MARRRFVFWLNDTKSDENELIGQVYELKRQRSFTATIRDGMRLITSLRDGDLDVLFELFPWVRAEFAKYIQSLQQATAAPQAAYTGLQPVQAQAPTNGATVVMQPIAGDVAVMSVPQFAAPAYDDDDIELTVTEAVGDGTAGETFLRAMLALQES